MQKSKAMLLTLAGTGLLVTGLSSIPTTGCVISDRCIRFPAEGYRYCKLFNNAAGVDENNQVVDPIFDGGFNAIAGCICVTEEEKAIIEEADVNNLDYQTWLARWSSRPASAAANSPKAGSLRTAGIPSQSAGPSKKLTPWAARRAAFT